LGLEPVQEDLFIEYYGDSNAAGHSVWNTEDRGASIDNGGYFTFSGITARLQGADYHNMIIGGAGITNKP
jgi:hypothetical protein